MSSTFVIEPRNPRADAIRANAVEFIGKLPTNKAWHIEIKAHRRNRSNEQNAWLWGVAYKIIETETGQEAADWHEYMLGEWSGWEVVELFGQKKRRPRRRSSKLSTVEFGDFKDFIQRRCAEFGLYIPDPQEQMPEYMQRGE